MNRRLPFATGLLAGLLCAVPVFGQAPALHKHPGLKKAEPMLKTWDLPVPVQESSPGMPSLEERGTEQDVLIGETIYDLQSNYSVCNRLSQDADGNIMAVWTMGFQSSQGYPDRGTGYNRFDAATGTWGSLPNSRLEATVRSGWPNHVLTESGTEFIVTHIFASPEYRLHTLRREPGQTDWTEADIPSATPVGVLWPRAAGSGETIHVIAITTPESLDGELYEGMESHLLYYRSTDGGQTWDITDGIIPGLDTTYTYDLGGADCYAIDARGDVVAIGVFSQWNDTKVFISEDGGDTWTNTTVFDFPLDKYQVDQGYTVSDLPLYDPNQPDSLAILTNDNTGHVLIDKIGNVHVFYGNMYVLDDNLTDEGWSYFPATSGLSYWNETFGPDSVNIIADVLDLNGNDTLDVAGIAAIPRYFMSLTSMPSAAVDEQNALYLAYSMLMEGEDYYNNEEAQHYRHIFIIKSEDGGASWSEPFDAINILTVGDSLFTHFIEAVFPHMNRDIAVGDIQFIYQQDYVPGLSARGDEDIPGDNYIIFTQVGALLSGQQEAPAPQHNLQLAPNPASGSTSVQFALKGASRAQLDLFDLMGKKVRHIAVAEYGAGEHAVSLDVDQLTPGIYFVRLMVGPTMTVAKLIVE